MAGVFAAAIEAPWCYLEFGDVGWCRDPARLDRRLHDAGLQIAAQERAPPDARAGDRFDGMRNSRRFARRGAVAQRPMLRGARTNGAVSSHSRPTTGAQLDQPGVLAAARAVRRARRHVVPRTDGRPGGVPHGRRHLAASRRPAADLAGALGMLLLLGFIALRLLAAALLSLL